MEFQDLFQKRKSKIAAIILFLSVFCIFSTFAQTLLGDANSDGTITIVDAQVVARYSAGLSVSTINTSNADVDKNTKVEITDALLIAQYSAGIIKTFPGQTTSTPPVAAFTISNLTPALNADVTFNASGSSDPDGTITGYSWDFGDGTAKGTGVTVSHAFTTMDDFKVALTVTDNSGLTKKLTQKVFVGRPTGWTEATHSKSADGNYNMIFPQDKVNRLDIVIASSDFQTMESNLNTLSMMSTTDPVYVPCTVKFNNLTWWKVGVRYKGQSTLFGPKQSGKHKYPLHLNFDKFEDTYPEIKNQRLYGFSELRCGNNWYDPTFVRDKVFADMLRDGGIPTAKCAFYTIYVDTGSGPVCWGLYTVLEDHGDQMMKTQFADDTGNLYKGLSSTGFGASTAKLDQTTYEKKTNEEANDWSDMNALSTQLNASRTDAAAWRAGLESVFDVDKFIRWLAINTAAINFDAYGWVIKNTYFYQDLANGGRLVHLPWDFNLSFMRGTVAGMPITILSLSLSEVSGQQWPLIRYLMDDPVYKNKYNQEMRTAMSGCFNKTTIINKVNQWKTLIQSSVQAESGIYTYLTNGTTEFNQGHTDLLNLINTRQTEVTSYLNTVP